MTSNHKTQLIAEVGKQELFNSREFDAPQELVFRAFSNPAILEQFFAPAGMTMKFDVADMSSGGKYRYTQSDPNGHVLAAFRGVIHEVTSPERIIQTQEMEGLPQAGHVVLEAMHFERLKVLLRYHLNNLVIYFLTVCVTPSVKLLVWVP